MIRGKGFEAGAAQPEPLLHPALRISHSNLDAGLCEVNANDRRMHFGGLLLFGLLYAQSAWHVDADRPAGGVHLIIPGGSRPSLGYALGLILLPTSGLGPFV